MQLLIIHAELTPNAIADAPPEAIAAPTETVANPQGTNSAPALINFSLRIFSMELTPCQPTPQLAINDSLNSLGLFMFKPLCGAF